MLHRLRILLTNCRIKAAYLSWRWEDVTWRACFAAWLVATFPQARLEERPPRDD
jgi:hypothetical protein